MSKKYFLRNDLIRANCADWVLRTAADGDVVSIARPTRSLIQNARFHAMLGDIEKQCKHYGRTITAAQWKVLFISGFGIVTGQGSDVVPGLEGEMCNIRESSASMGVKRMAELITYLLAYGDNYRDEFGNAKPVIWTDPDKVPEWAKT